MRGMGQRAGQRGREGDGEGKERRLRRKGDTQVTFYFSFVLSYTDCIDWWGL